MKICYVDKVKKKMILSADYWEVESLGYDVIEEKDVLGTFYKSIIQEISEIVCRVFGKDFRFGIQTYLDPDKGMFYYEIKPYGERIDEFIMEEMVKNHYSATFIFPYGIQ